MRNEYLYAEFLTLLVVVTENSKHESSLGARGSIDASILDGLDEVHEALQVMSTEWKRESVMKPWEVLENNGNGVGGERE
jgi:hypothetical protein